MTGLPKFLNVVSFTHTEPMTQVCAND
jgi:hypothetical protein